MPNRPIAPAAAAGAAAGVGATTAQAAQTAAQAAAEGTHGGSGSKTPAKKTIIGTPAACGFLKSKMRRKSNSTLRSQSAPRPGQPAAAPRLLSAPATGAQRSTAVAAAAASAATVATTDRSPGFGAAVVTVQAGRGRGGQSVAGSTLAGSSQPGFGLQAPRPQQQQQQPVGAPIVRAMAAMKGAEPSASAVHSMMLEQFPAPGGGGGGLRSLDLSAGREQAAHQVFVPAVASAAVVSPPPTRPGFTPPTASTAWGQISSSNPAAAAVDATPNGSNGGLSLPASSRGGAPWEGVAPTSNGRVGTEPWDEEEANGGPAQAGGGGGQGSAASGGGGGGEVDAWAVSPSRVLSVGGGDIIGYRVEEEAETMSTDTSVLLLEETEVSRWVRL